MKKPILLLPLFALLFFACTKEVDNVIPQPKSDEPVVTMSKGADGVMSIVVSPAPGTEAKDRTLCTLYEAMRFADGDDLTTANPVNCDVEFRLLKFNLTTFAVTEVYTYQTSNNVSGLNITWANVDNSSGYRYYGGYKKCVKHGSPSTTIYIHDFFGDDSGTHSDPLWSSDSAGSFQGPVAANTVPNEWTATGATFSGCNVFP